MGRRGRGWRLVPGVVLGAVVCAACLVPVGAVGALRGRPRSPAPVAAPAALTTVTSGPTGPAAPTDTFRSPGVTRQKATVAPSPALLQLDIRGYAGQNAKLLFWFVAVTELSDVMQYVWGKLCGRRKIAPTVSPGKTWEGFLGGGLTTVALGAALWWITPFTPLEAGLIALVINVMGFFGGFVLSAIKRDRGVKDWGAMIEGHGGMLDRVDSISFSAPIFFHIVRYWWVA